MNGKRDIFIGTNTGSGVFKAEYQNGNLTNLKPYYQIKNPSYLTSDVKKNILFALSERGDGADIFSLNNLDTIENSKINVPGRGLCHISISTDNRFIFGACYESGHIYSVSVNENGNLEKVISAIDQNQYQNIKSSKARAHCIKSPDGKNVFAVDLGLDALIVYSLNEKGELNYNSHYRFKDGTGPRHICFNKFDSSVIYLISEYSNELYTFKFDEKEGTLICLNNVSSLPSDFKGKSHGAAVKMSPDGKKVAVSNRVEGADGIISIFNIKDNLPCDMETIKTAGCFPRDFEFTPDLKYIIATNQVSNVVSIISLQDGTNNIYNVPQPVCIEFL